MYINIGDESVADDYIREALGWLNNHMGSEHDTFTTDAQCTVCAHSGGAKIACVPMRLQIMCAWPAICSGP